MKTKEQVEEALCSVKEQIAMVQDQVNCLDSQFNQLTASRDSIRALMTANDKSIAETHDKENLEKLFEVAKTLRSQDADVFNQIVEVTSTLREKQCLLIKLAGHREACEWFLEGDSES